MKCKAHNAVGCAEPECVAARRLWVEGRYPLLIARADEIQAGHIPPEQALAYRLEEEEILEAKLAITRAEIAILRD